MGEQNKAVNMAAKSSAGHPLVNCPQQVTCTPLGVQTAWGELIIGSRGVPCIPQPGQGSPQNLLNAVLPCIGTGLAKKNWVLSLNGIYLLGQILT